MTTCLCGCGRLVPNLSGRRLLHPVCRDRRRVQDIPAAEIERRFQIAKARIAAERRMALDIPLESQ